MPQMGRKWQRTAYEDIPEISLTDTNTSFGLTRSKEFIIPPGDNIIQELTKERILHILTNICNKKSIKWCEKISTTRIYMTENSMKKFKSKHSIKHKKSPEYILVREERRNKLKQDFVKPLPDIHKMI